jgi:hypothetical protein
MKFKKGDLVIVPIPYVQGVESQKGDIFQVTTVLKRRLDQTGYEYHIRRVLPKSRAEPIGAYQWGIHGINMRLHDKDFSKLEKLIYGDL